jgi:hypothetical protein
MADNIKQLKSAINAKRQAIAAEEEGRATWADQVSCAPRNCIVDPTDVV